MTAEQQPTRSQVGRIGEVALELYLLVTSGGALDPYRPEVDEHVDWVVSRHDALAVVGLQVKTAPKLDAHGLAEAIAHYPKGKVVQESDFFYTVLLMAGVAIEAAWLVPSADFNRLANRSFSGGEEQLAFRAHPLREDRWSPFRLDPLRLGPAVLDLFSSVPQEPTAWLLALGRRRPT